MKNYLIVGLICLVAFFTIGIEPLQRGINEATNKGSLRGVENCMVYSKSDLLSESAVKATCVSTFQKNLYNSDLATGRAGPLGDQRGISWGGNLHNKTSDHVTTWIRVSVSAYDADGDKEDFQAETRIWIDPMSSTYFSVELPEMTPGQLENIEFCDRDDVQLKACMMWTITEIMGLTI